MLLEKKKILITLPALKGGLCTAIWNLCEGLVRLGNSVIVICGVADEQVLFKSTETAGIKIVVLNERRTLPLVIKASTVMRSINFDCHISTGMQFAALMISFHKLLKLNGSVIQRESMAVEGHLAIAGKLRRWIYSKVLSLGYHFADQIVITTDEMRPFLERRFKVPREKLTTIPNIVNCSAIEANRYPNDQDNIVELIRYKRTILYIGRFSEQKRVDDLIAAFNHACDEIKAQLVLVGEGPEYKNICRMIKNYGLSDRVCVFEWQDNPIPLIMAADIFVLPSGGEGFPNALAEAVYLEKRIVATTCQTGPRTLTKNGEFGALVPVGDIKAIAKELIKSEMENWTVPTGGRRYIEKEFSPYSVGRKYSELIFSLENSILK